MAEGLTYSAFSADVTFSSCAVHYSFDTGP